MSKSTMEIMVEATEIMLKAADDMEKRGWNDYIRHADNGSVCVLGAVENALGSQSLTDELAKEIRVRLGLPDLSEEHANNADQWSLAEWSNNADGPTVVAALRKAATSEPAKE